MSWSAAEHQRFLEALERFGSGSSGREFEQMAAVVGSRTPREVKEHATKYFRQLNAAKVRSAGSGGAQTRPWTWHEEQSFEALLAATDCDAIVAATWAQLAQRMQGRSAAELEARYAVLTTDLLRIKAGERVEIEYADPPAPAAPAPGSASDGSASARAAAGMPEPQAAAALAGAAPAAQDLAQCVPAATAPDGSSAAAAVVAGLDVVRAGLAAAAAADALAGAGGGAAAAGAAPAAAAAAAPVAAVAEPAPAAAEPAPETQAEPEPQTEEEEEARPTRARAPRKAKGGKEAADEVSPSKRRRRG